MPTAYVLINCDFGFEEDIIQELKHVPEIQEIHGAFGAYDIVAKVVSPSVDSLRDTVAWRIRKIARIRSTLTLMCIQGQEFIR